MEFDEKELRKEIAFAIRNIHGNNTVIAKLTLIQESIFFKFCTNMTKGVRVERE